MQKANKKNIYLCATERFSFHFAAVDHFTHRAYNHIGFGYSSLFNRQTINPGGVLVGGGPVMAPQEQNSVRSLTQWGEKSAVLPPRRWILSFTAALILIKKTWHIISLSVMTHSSLPPSHGLFNLISFCRYTIGQTENVCFHLGYIESMRRLSKKKHEKKAMMGCGGGCPAFIFINVYQCSCCAHLLPCVKRPVCACLLLLLLPPTAYLHMNNLHDHTHTHSHTHSCATLD